jgi:hypothetical protein
MPSIAAPARSRRAVTVIPGTSSAVTVRRSASVHHRHDSGVAPGCSCPDDQDAHGEAV